MRRIPLRHLAEIRVSNVDKKTAEGEVPVRLCNYTDVYYNERVTSTLDFMEATAKFDQCIAYQIRRGDVLITKDSETADDIGVSAYVAETVPNVLCGYHLALVRPRAHEVDGRYLRWALASTEAREQMAAKATGITRFGLRSSAIAGLVIPAPDPAFQRKIADYLDHETARIDALIQKKELLGAAVAERFVALIDNSIQGTPVPLKRLLARPLQYGANETGEVGDAEWPRYIRITDLRGDGTLRDDTELQLSPLSAVGYYLKEGDLLFARSGATVGKCFKFSTANGPSCFAGYLIRARMDRSRALPEYVYLWTQSTDYWSQIRRASIQATIQNVGASRYGSLTVPVPSLPVQGAIVKRSEASGDWARATSAAIARQVTLLHERRHALITAAVTGQLDIPEAA
jgi:type I restriction enzyme S subunit